MLWTVCWVTTLPAMTATAKEKLPKNTQIVYPNEDGTAVELDLVLMGGVQVKKRLLTETEWTFTRKDVDKVNTLFDNTVECEKHVLELESEIEKLLRDDGAPPPKKPFFSTTVGHWTIGVGVAGLFIGGFAAGHHFGRK